MKISGLEFSNDVFLAPMAGVTDIIFRGICKDMGCGLVYTEMISAKALYYGSENTKELLKVSNKESPAAVQIFGSEPLVMAKACDFFNNDKNICLVDINMGCPAHKIVKNGEGSALMKDPQLAADIVREVKRASTKPVTVKFRKGFDSSNINAVEFAKKMEDAGADAVTVHGRTREQMYEGKADWNIIAEVKKQLSIPVIGNGDIFLAEDALKIREQTQCDGIMIARGAMGNPWIFREINQAIRGEIIVKPSVEEKIDLCIAHLKLAVDHYGEAKAIREMRKNIAWYLKGLKNSTDIKNKVNYEGHSDKVIEILKNYKSLLAQK
ncbi:tRNA dihydrouridine synthase DusB [Clostridium pasteurianum]|uniref:tRNA-dihydrouridine synthase n=1 Tax=Clostridium pasteurianum BC1 TaxID=86416 RepID=R4KC37_CLOPA|nr:tRNA dihydrouridine synthase DusB [Clostridium pasteurianum]AGK99261.1 putative TIM-barrel protein, nifR3 family [Clostridium pasteurianum BC1]